MRRAMRAVCPPRLQYSTSTDFITAASCLADPAGDATRPGRHAESRKAVIAARAAGVLDHNHLS
jgi:hypothetical protein